MILWFLWEHLRFWCGFYGNISGFGVVSHASLGTQGATVSSMKQKLRASTARDFITSCLTMLNKSQSLR